jgi:hypothetical protein
MRAALSSPTAARPLGTAALNRAVSGQRLWLVVDAITGRIVFARATRREARKLQPEQTVIRLVDVRVRGMRA